MRETTEHAQRSKPTPKPSAHGFTILDRDRGYYETDYINIRELIASGSLDAIAEPLNPAEITRRINRIQQQLIAAVKARTQAGRTAA